MRVADYGDDSDSDDDIDSDDSDDDDDGDNDDDSDSDDDKNHEWRSVTWVVSGLRLVIIEVLLGLHRACWTKACDHEKHFVI